MTDPTTPDVDTYCPYRGQNWSSFSVHLVFGTLCVCAVLGLEPKTETLCRLFSRGEDMEILCRQFQATSFVASCVAAVSGTRWFQASAL